jgi:hypothetical protein
MPKLYKLVTVGCKIPREELPAMRSVALACGYKNLSSWMEALLRRAYNQAVSDILRDKERFRHVEEHAQMG